MKIHNHLPLLLDCLKRWEARPSIEQFRTELADPLTETCGDFFQDFEDVLQNLNWKQYRDHTLLLDADRELNRLKHWISAVEQLFGFQLEGEVLLLGTFHTYDGFARFDRGRHRVFLGVDENHHQPHYLDVLMTHELTHVARETRPEVWLGYGLDPQMDRQVYLDSQTVIEHLMGEGLSCFVSECLVPGLKPWSYVYQTEKSYQNVIQNQKQIDDFVKNELRYSDVDSDYSRLYQIEPRYGHYVWAHEWIKNWAKTNHNDRSSAARHLVSLCSKNEVNDAMSFKLFL